MVYQRKSLHPITIRTIQWTMTTPTIRLNIARDLKHLQIWELIWQLTTDLESKERICTSKVKLSPPLPRVLVDPIHFLSRIWIDRRTDLLQTISSWVRGFKTMISVLLVKLMLQTAIQKLQIVAFSQAIWTHPNRIKWYLQKVRKDCNNILGFILTIKAQLPNQEVLASPRIRASSSLSSGTHLQRPR